MWFFISFVALLCWSGSDLFCKLGSSPEDKHSHLKMIMVLGFSMGIHGIIQVTTAKVSITGYDVKMYLPVILFSIVVMSVGFIGLRYIELSISSPICNSSGAIVIILSVCLLGQTINRIQMIATGMILFCILTMSIMVWTEDDTHRKERQEEAKIKYPKSKIGLMISLTYCMLCGIGNFAEVLVLQKIDEGAANIIYEFTFFCAAVLVLFYLKLIKREKILKKRELPKLLGAIFETAGQYAYMYAVAKNAFLAVPVIYSYCMGSIVWGRLFLGEELTIKQYLVLFVGILGIVILGAVG